MQQIINLFLQVDLLQARIFLDRRQMDSISTSSKKSRLLYKIALKNILAYIMAQQFACQTVISRLSRLAKVEIAIRIDRALIKERELLCFQCRQIFTNKLIYILHLQLVHRDQITIAKYEFQREKIVIHVQSKGSQGTQYLLEKENHLTLVASFRERMFDILDHIFRKFAHRKARKDKRTYYHSNNLFQEIGTSSEEEDSENEAGYIERDLEKHRINDFQDVNEKDKLLFNMWNDMVHEAKKVSQIIDHADMVKLLQNFARECKRQGIKRMNFFTHAWTLWSAGKIGSHDVSYALTAYDGNQ